MNFFERIAETKIREAMERGELDQPGTTGKPLDLDSLRGVKPEDRAAYTLLRSSGFAPGEVHTRRELADVDAKMQRAIEGGADVEDGELERLRRQRLALELKRNIAADRRLGRL